MTEDEKIQDIVIAMIRRKSMNPEAWRFTIIAELHLRLRERLSLFAGELPLASAFFSETSWYAFTTRRIISHLDSATAFIDPTHGITADVGNFKGLGSIPVEVATISTRSGAKIRFEYETGKASMAPIYATRYWEQKHSVLLTTEHETNIRNV